MHRGAWRSGAVRCFPDLRREGLVELRTVLIVDRQRWVSDAKRRDAQRCTASRCSAIVSRPSPRRAGRVEEGSCSWNSQAMGERGEAMRCKATMSGAAVPGLDHVGLTELRTVLIVDRKRWVSGAKRCEAAQRNAGRSEAMRSGAQRWFPRLQHEGLPRVWRVLVRGTHKRWEGVAERCNERRCIALKSEALRCDGSRS